MIAKIHNFGALREALAFNNETLSGYFQRNLRSIDHIAINIKFENVSCAVLAKKSVKKSTARSEFFCCLIVITAKSPKVWPALINSHFFVQTLTNQKSRTVSSWLLIELNLYERMWISKKRPHFWAPYRKPVNYFLLLSPWLHNASFLSILLHKKVLAIQQSWWKNINLVQNVPQKRSL